MPHQLKMGGSLQRGCRLWAVILASVFVLVAQAQGPIPGPGDFPQVQITSGQQLVDALQEVYATGSNATLNLPPGLTSLANASWQVPSGPSVSGWATVLGVNASTGNQVNLTNLLIINSCADVYYISPTLNLGVMMTTLQYAFGDVPVARVRYQTNLTVLGHRQEIAIYAFWMMYLTTNLPALKAVAAPFVGSLAAPLASTVGIRDLTPTIISWYSIPKGNSFDTNVTYQAWDDPTLPPQYRIPDAGGTLMPPQHCNGSALANNVSRLEVYTTLQPQPLPMWVVDTTLGFRIALNMAMVFIQNRAAPAPAAMIAVTQNSTMPDQAASLILRNYEIIIMGIWNMVPETARFVALDLANTPDIMQVSPSNIMRPYAKALGSLAQPNDAAGQAYVSALPLWAFSLGSRTGDPYIIMENVTLFLPTSDYAALLSAALRGPAWQSGANTTAALLSGVTAFVLAPDANVSSASTSLSFSYFAAWGWNASGLIIQPDSPLGTAYSLPDLMPPAPPPSPSPSPPDSSGSSTSGTAFGVGIGVGIGGALLLALAAGLFLWHRSRRRRKAHWAAEHHGDVESKISSAGSKGNTSHPHSQGSRMESLPPSTPKRSLQDAQDGSRTKVPGSDASSAEPGTAGQSSGQGPDHAAELIKKGTTPRQAVQQAMGALGAADADKVTLLGVIGKGAGGTVYRGKWRGLDVAVKTVLFSDNNASGNTRGMLPKDRAVTEAAVCQSVSHRNVVSTYHYDIKPVQTMEQSSGVVLDMGDSDVENVTEWRLYLVQEWCNSNLKDAIMKGLLHTQLVDGKPTAAIDIVLSLLLDVAQGLSYLHSKNILHGDLKPENVLLKTDFTAPSKCVAKITDFGLSATLDPRQTHISNYSSGTPFYVSPEVLHSGRAVKASDVYSFGVLAWEIYHGTPPWVRSPNGAFVAHPAFPSLSAPCPPVFASLVTRCLRKEFEERPSLQELITELGEMHVAWLEGYDSLVRPSRGSQPRPSGSPAQDGHLVGPDSMPQSALAAAGVVTQASSVPSGLPAAQGGPEQGGGDVSQKISTATNMRIAEMGVHGGPLSSYLMSQVALPPRNNSQATSQSSSSAQ